MTQGASSKRRKSGHMNGHARDSQDVKPQRDTLSSNGSRSRREGYNTQQSQALDDMQSGKTEGITGQTSRSGAHLKTHYTKDTFLCPSGMQTTLMRS